MRLDPRTTLHAVFFAFLAVACAETRGEPALTAAGPGEFASHWFDGRAEVTRYRLEQSRYGELHDGNAVLIFVTEDFQPDRQVKSESGGAGSVPVLKLNFTRKFNTGVYPYSIMSSIFSPLGLAAYPHALKTSTSVQEWCGHTYLQLNRRDGGYRVTGHSYFESEADEAFDLPSAWLEDEIWTRIRLAPDRLPTGSFEMIPGAQPSRLLHRFLAVERAEAWFDTEGDFATYSLTYPDSGRSLSIRFESAFPHDILGWEETDGGGLTTRATLEQSMRLDYWNRNRNADAGLRSELGLD